MDIVRRAYNNIRDETKASPNVQMFHDLVVDEAKRFIRRGVYSGRDWPREWGPIPDELRSKRERKAKSNDSCPLTIRNYPDCYEDCPDIGTCRHRSLPERSQKGGVLVEAGKGPIRAGSRTVVK